VNNITDLSMNESSFIDQCSQYMVADRCEYCVRCTMRLNKIDSDTKLTFAHTARCWYNTKYMNYYICIIFPICNRCENESGAIGARTISFYDWINTIIDNGGGDSSVPKLIPIVGSPNNIEMIAFRCATTIIAEIADTMVIDHRSAIDCAIEDSLKIAFAEWKKCTSARDTPRKVRTFIFPNVYEDEPIREFIARAALISGRDICLDLMQNISMRDMRIHFAHMVLRDGVPITFDRAINCANGCICACSHILMYSAHK